MHSRTSSSLPPYLFLSISLPRLSISCHPPPRTFCGLVAGHAHVILARRSHNLAPDGVTCLTIPTHTYLAAGYRIPDSILYTHAHIKYVYISGVTLLSVKNHRARVFSLAKQHARARDRSVDPSPLATRGARARAPIPEIFVAVLRRATIDFSSSSAVAHYIVALERLF